MNRMLMTPQSIQSFERTEAFEWSRRRGNRKTHIPSLQPFKFRYAELLADFGYEDLAREYLLSIRSCIGLDSGKGKGGKATTPTSGNLAYDLEFIESLKRLDDRICISTGAMPSLWESSNDDDTKAGSLAAMGSIVKSVLGKKINADDVPLSDDKLPKQASEKQIVEEEIVDESPREVAQLSMPEKQQQRQPNPIDDALEGGDESFITAKPSFDQTAVAVDDDPPISSPKLINNSSIDAPPSSAPPMFPMDHTSNPKEEKKKKTILSTPIQASKKAGKEKAPVSEPPRSAGWLSSGLKKASKLLGRDPDSKAVVCDPGLAMEAYYDEKLKRWIFPGDDPAEVAKPLAPPPTIPKTTDGPSTPAPSVAASNDPLAALMAPPPSGVLSRNKRGTPSLGMSRYSASPLTSIGNVPPSNNTPPASPMMAAPPTFATFVPKPSQKETDPSQEETHRGTLF